MIKCSSVSLLFFVGWILFQMIAGVHPARGQKQRESIAVSARLRKNGRCCVKFFLPAGQLAYFNNVTVEEAWETLGRYKVLAEVFYLNMYIGAKANNIPVVSRIDPKDGCLYVLRDWAYREALRSLPSEVRKSYARQNIYQIVPLCIRDPSPCEKTKVIQLGLPVINYNISFTDMYSDSLRKGLINLNNRDIITAYLGMPGLFSNNTYKREKRILVDEIYHGGGGVGFEGMLSKTFDQTMRVAAILHKTYGWSVGTFVGRWADIDLPFWETKYPWVEVQNVPQRLEYIKYLKNHTFAMHHMWESFGIPLYENLQLGIPVIVWQELVAPYVFQQFKNSVVCSLLEEPERCAAAVEFFYERRWSEQLFHEVQRSSNLLYSAESFGSQVVQALKCKSVGALGRHVNSQ